MLILVTGGAGFIGSHSVHALLEAGLRVRVLDNFSTGRRERLPEHPALEILSGDIRDRATVVAAFAGVDRVLHLAAQVSVARSVEAPEESAAHNIAGYLNVLEAARQHGIRRVVHASSAAVYGAGHGAPLSENDPPQPLSPYGLEKSVNDQYAALYCQLHGMETLGLRYFNVYGPGQDPHSSYSGVISIFCDRLRCRQPVQLFGDGQQTRDFVFVADVARANLAALTGHATGVCNVASGRSHSLLELLATLKGIAGCQTACEKLPPRAGDIRYSQADNRRLQETLGLRDFTPLDAGLRRLWASLG